MSRDTFKTITIVILAILVVVFMLILTAPSAVRWAADEIGQLWPGGKEKPVAAVAPTSIPAPTSTPAPAPTPVHPPEGDLAVEEWLGLNVWGGNQVNLNLPPLATNQVLMAHGDVLGNGTCAVKIFHPGDVIVLSDATWQLYRFTGEPEEVAQAIVEHQMEAAKDLDPNGDPTQLCPILD